MNAPSFGPALTKDGTRFRLWAPAAKRVDVLLEKPHAMRRSDDGWFTAEILGVAAGVRYKFRIDDEIDVPDPASAFQPEDVFGPSEVIDHAAFSWRATDWRGRPWAETVVIEAHAGTFTQAGSYRAMIEKLDHLVQTGITALELLPLADFAGSRNWGYDGVLWYAPDSAYGRPEELKALIDEAHLRGLMVFLDVVYNHFGPEGNYLGRYAPNFFTEAHTPWGSAIDYRGAAGARLCDRECGLLAARLSLRRAAPRCRQQHRRARRIVAVERPQSCGGRTRARRPAVTSIWCSKTATTAPACWMPPKGRRAANIARSGTTTIITPGACC